MQGLHAHSLTVEEGEEEEEEQEEEEEDVCSELKRGRRGRTGMKRGTSRYAAIWVHHERTARTSRQARRGGGGGECVTEGWCTASNGRSEKSKGAMAMS